MQQIESIKRIIINGYDIKIERKEGCEFLEMDTRERRESMVEFLKAFGLFKKTMFL